MADGVVLAFPQRPDDRLRLSLLRLEEALAEQREAVAAWRSSLADLTEATGRLDRSLLGYGAGLDSVAQAVRHADAEVRRLEGTADALLAFAALQRA